MISSPSVELPAFITAKEAARVLRIGMTKFYRQIHDNRIPHVRSGNKGNAPILVSVSDLRSIIEEAAGFKPGFENAILDAINSPDVKRGRGRPSRIKTPDGPFNRQRGLTLRRAEGVGDTSSIKMTSEGNHPSGQVLMAEHVIIEYAKIFNLFLSSAIELQTFKDEAVAKAIDALDDSEGEFHRSPKSDNRPIRTTFAQLRAVYKKLGRKATYLYSKLPAEIKPVFKDPAEIKKSLLSNLIYREDLKRCTNVMTSLANAKNTACDKIIESLIKTGYFSKERDFGSILAEVLKTELSCSDRSIRRALKKVVISGRLNTGGYGKGTKYAR